MKKGDMIQRDDGGARHKVMEWRAGPREGGYGDVRLDAGDWIPVCWLLAMGWRVFRVGENGPQ